MRVLGRALAQLAGAAEPLLPWLKDEVQRGGNSPEMVLSDPTQVLSLALLSACGFKGFVEPCSVQ